MNTAHTLIIRHCRNQLIARGWPSSLEVETSQHYRAGDGVAFYGKLKTKTLLALLPVLQAKGLLEETVVAELKETITDTRSSVLLNRNHLSERYSHAGTMTLRYSSDMQAPLIQLLLKALRAEINDICGRVAANGYRLCDAVNPSYRPAVFQRKTRNFVVSVTEAKPAEQGIDEWSNDALDSCIDAILQKNATFRTLEIRISYGENNKILGRSWVNYVKRLPDQPVRCWFGRELLRDAVTEAKENIADMLVALDSFKQAA
ncbi:hypothetical protein [Rahnella sp. ChDrAdgB13]|uniref:hypothetical protein n=1 Tax=Rahnella sp. ChDrAdgB13 TaxID=1850581 RepID=UPI001AD85C75|nr:hypothetical protein [Rahnella sp. ChDrAdgB13]